MEYFNERTQYLLNNFDPKALEVFIEFVIVYVLEFNGKFTLMSPIFTAYGPILLGLWRRSPNSPRGHTETLPTQLGTPTPQPAGTLRFGDINITVNASGNADGIADAVRAAVLDVLTDTLDRAAVTA